MTEMQTAVAMMGRSREQSMESMRRPAEHGRIEPCKQPQKKQETTRRQ